MEHKPYARILAAVDRDPADHEKTALNEKIMELACSLAGLEQSELHIVHAWRFEWEWLIRTHRGVSPDKLDGIKTMMRGTHEQWLSELLAKCPLKDLKHKVHRLNGEAGTVIPGLAREKKIEVIAMGTVCRTGIEGFLIGNTVEKILRQVDCSGLAIKPDGFQTPTKLD